MKDTGWAVEGGEPISTSPPRLGLLLVMARLDGNTTVVHGRSGALPFSKCGVRYRPSLSAQSAQAAMAGIVGRYASGRYTCEPDSLNSADLLLIPSAASSLSS